MVLRDERFRLELQEERDVPARRVASNEQQQQQPASGASVNAASGDVPVLEGFRQGTPPPPVTPPVPSLSGQEVSPEAASSPSNPLESSIGQSDLSSYGNGPRIGLQMGQLPPPSQQAFTSGYAPLPDDSSLRAPAESIRRLDPELARIDSPFANVAPGTGDLASTQRAIEADLLKPYLDEQGSIDPNKPITYGYPYQYLPPDSPELPATDVNPFTLSEQSVSQYLESTGNYNEALLSETLREANAMRYSPRLISLAGLDRQIADNINDVSSRNAARQQAREQLLRGMRDGAATGVTATENAMAQNGFISRLGQALSRKQGGQGNLASRVLRGGVGLIGDFLGDLSTLGDIAGSFVDPRLYVGFGRAFGRAVQSSQPRERFLRKLEENNRVSAESERGLRRFLPEWVERAGDAVGAAASTLGGTVGQAFQTPNWQRTAQDLYSQQTRDRVARLGSTVTEQQQYAAQRQAETGRRYEVVNTEDGRLGFRAGNTFFGVTPDNRFVFGDYGQGITGGVLWGVDLITESLPRAAIYQAADWYTESQTGQSVNANRWVDALVGVDTSFTQARGETNYLAQLDPEAPAAEQWMRGLFADMVMPGAGDVRNAIRNGIRASRGLPAVGAGAVESVQRNAQRYASPTPDLDPANAVRSTPIPDNARNLTPDVASPYPGLGNVYIPPDQTQLWMQNQLRNQFRQSAPGGAGGAGRPITILAPDPIQASIIPNLPSNIPAPSTINPDQFARSMSSNLPDLSVLEQVNRAMPRGSQVIPPDAVLNRAAGTDPFASVVTRGMPDLVPDTEQLTGVQFVEALHEASKQRVTNTLGLDLSNLETGGRVPLSSSIVPVPSVSGSNLPVVSSGRIVPEDIATDLGLAPSPRIDNRLTGEQFYRGLVSKDSPRPPVNLAEVEFVEAAPGNALVLSIPDSINARRIVPELPEQTLNQARRTGNAIIDSTGNIQDSFRRYSDVVSQLKRMESVLDGTRRAFDDNYLPSAGVLAGSNYEVAESVVAHLRQQRDELRELVIRQVAQPHTLDALNAASDEALVSIGKLARRQAEMSRVPQRTTRFLEDAGTLDIPTQVVQKSLPPAALVDGLDADGLFRRVISPRIDGQPRSVMQHAHLPVTQDDFDIAARFINPTEDLVGTRSVELESLFRQTDSIVPSNVAKHVAANRQYRSVVSQLQALPSAKAPDIDHSPPKLVRRNRRQLTALARTTTNPETGVPYFNNWGRSMTNYELAQLRDQAGDIFDVVGAPIDVDALESSRKLVKISGGSRATEAPTYKLAGDDTPKSSVVDDLYGDNRAAALELDSQREQLSNRLNALDPMSDEFDETMDSILELDRQMDELAEQAAKRVYKDEFIEQVAPDSYKPALDEAVPADEAVEAAQIEVADSHLRTVELGNAAKATESQILDVSDGIRRDRLELETDLSNHGRGNASSEIATQEHSGLISPEESPLRLARQDTRGSQPKPRSSADFPIQQKTGENLNPDQLSVLKQVRERTRRARDADWATVQQLSADLNMSDDEVRSLLWSMRADRRIDINPGNETRPTIPDEIDAVSISKTYNLIEDEFVFDDTKIDWVVPARAGKNAQLIYVNPSDLPVSMSGRQGVTELTDYLGTNKELTYPIVTMGSNGQLKVRGGSSTIALYQTAGKDRMIVLANKVEQFEVPYQVAPDAPTAQVATQAPVVTRRTPAKKRQAATPTVAATEPIMDLSDRQVVMELHDVATSAKQKEAVSLVARLVTNPTAATVEDIVNLVRVPAATRRKLTSYGSLTNRLLPDLISQLSADQKAELLEAFSKSGATSYEGAVSIVRQYAKEGAPVSTRGRLVEEVVSKTWFHGTRRDIGNLANLHPGQGGTFSELGAGVYFTQSEELAGRYARAAMPDNLVPIPDVRYLPVGAVHEASVSVRNPLDADTFPANVKQTIVDALEDEGLPELVDTVNRTDSYKDVLTRLRADYVDLNHGSPMSEIDALALQEVVTRAVTDAGFDSVYMQTKGGQVLAVLDSFTDAQLPIKQIDRRALVGNPSRQEALYNRYLVDREASLAVDNRYTRANEIQSRVAYEEYMVDNELHPQWEQLQAEAKQAAESFGNAKIDLDEAVFQHQRQTIDLMEGRQPTLFTGEQARHTFDNNLCL